MTIFSSRKILRRACLFMLFLFMGKILYCQDVGEPEKVKVIAKEWNIELFLNTSGGGIGFQSGWTPDYYNKHFWEINFLYNQHAKEVRARNTYYSDATAFSYGKLVNLFFLRAGYGYQRTLNHKPYWGGVQVRYTLSGGFSLGMGMPVYLNVLYYTPDGTSVYKKTEAYNPDYHDIDNIVGRGPFFGGILETKLRPGFYCKMGLNFDFSNRDMVIHAVEVGVTADMVFPFIQQIAYRDPKPFYFCAYIAYNFGKKKGTYD